jgi:hypothetical protein
MEKTFEDFLKDEIKIDRLTPIQYSGIVRAHIKWELHSKQKLGIPGIVRPASEGAQEGEPLPAEAVAQSRRVVEYCKCGQYMMTAHAPCPCERTD